MMIFISGFARTGTSILFRCLQKSGFNGGDNLFGHKYETQDKRLYWLRYSIENKMVNPNNYRRVINDFFNYCSVQDIDILKDPHIWTIFNALYAYSEEFRHAKFIWTQRNPLEIAKSQVRLHRQFNMPPVEENGKITVKGALRAYKDFEQIFYKYRFKLRSLIVRFDDLVYNPKAIQPMISGFVGKDLDISEISPEETFRHRRVAQ